MALLNNKQFIGVAVVGVLGIWYVKTKVFNAFGSLADTIANAPGDLADSVKGVFITPPVDVSGFKPLPRTRVDTSYVPRLARGPITTGEKSQINTQAKGDNDIAPIDINFHSGGHL